MTEQTTQLEAIDKMPVNWSFTTGCNDPIYFDGTQGIYGCFSNSMTSNFQVDGVEFGSSEQYRNSPTHSEY